MNPQKNIQLIGSSKRDPKGLKRKRTFKNIVLCEATAPNRRKIAKIKIDHYDTHICNCEDHPHKRTLFSTVPIDRTMKADARDHRVALHEAGTGDPGVGAGEGARPESAPKRGRSRQQAGQHAKPSCGVSAPSQKRPESN